MLFFAMIFLAGIGLTVVESVFVPSVRIAGIRPDLVVLVAVVATRRMNFERVMVMAFILGLIRDLFSIGLVGMSAFSQVGLVGMSAFSLVLMVYVLLIAEEYFLTDNWKSQVFVGFLGYVIFGSLFAFLKILAGYEVTSVLRVAEIVLGTAVYTALLTPFGFMLSHRPDLPAYMRLRNKYNAEHETLHQSEV
jgi:rod shape-determining protein MreD